MLPECAEWQNSQAREHAASPWVDAGNCSGERLDGATRGLAFRALDGLSLTLGAFAFVGVEQAFAQPD